MRSIRPLLVYAYLFSAMACATGSGNGDSGAAATGDAAEPDLGSGVDASGSDAALGDTAVADDANVIDASAADAGCGIVWPACDAQPAMTMSSTIAQIWTDDPAAPSYRWVSGAIVTAVSHAGCVAGSACEIFVQEPTGATTIDGAAHHAIKVFVSAASASHFTGIAVGDQVDIAAHAWRYTVGGENELLLQVADSCSLRGCMTRTGAGAIDAVPATLEVLGSVAAYEQTYGPVLVELANVSATADPTSPTDHTTGGLYVPGSTFDAGVTQPVSVSPYFLPNGRFVGVTAGQHLHWSTLTGVFGLFTPAAGDGGMPAKYLEIYPRTTADLVP